MNVHFVPVTRYHYLVSNLRLRNTYLPFEQDFTNCNQFCTMWKINNMWAYFHNEFFPIYQSNSQESTFPLSLFLGSRRTFTFLINPRWCQTVENIHQKLFESLIKIQLVLFALKLVKSLRWWWYKMDFLVSLKSNLRFAFDLIESLTNSSFWRIQKGTSWTLSSLSSYTGCPKNAS